MTVTTNKGIYMSFPDFFKGSSEYKFYLCKCEYKFLDIVCAIKI